MPCGELRLVLNALISLWFGEVGWGEICSVKVWHSKDALMFWGAVGQGSLCWSRLRYGEDELIQRSGRVRCGVLECVVLSFV